MTDQNIKAEAQHIVDALKTHWDPSLRALTVAILEEAVKIAANPESNDLTDIPAAACNKCGGWTSFGGMSQHSKTTTPVLGRTGCTCH